MTNEENKRREPSEQADNANLVDNGDLPRN